MAHQTVGLLQPCEALDAELPPACPVDVALDALRGRWTALIIGEFRHGDRSFTQLREGLPRLSDKVLTDRLQQLTTSGVLERTRQRGWPPRVSYALTPRGRALVPALRALWEWGSQQ
ncbi:transcriptional regulator, HxlR family [Kribbella flavida DSM 17836]|uniref:Transcriptional regulator, HxlR family n=1 Tax=Kribbella flavida (strain DSM 17836 / JCM 10339 / NBRC 14399) TaxID=479435 RepID=D2PX33_KRIFD|nr:helix-turn-helix domain-containing protein [Kribbella flavida]ADB35413.1 transcriptional regulator, HxlR family [Kribbella flavida DSM 17836]